MTQTMNAERDAASAMMRGARGLCPACGVGKLFRRYLKVADHCPACGEALYHQKADDAPPYMTILVVGHIVVPLLVIVEEAYRPEVWVHLALWLPLTLLLSLALLPVTKGALVGLQWALRMHGFDPDSPEHEALPPAAAAGKTPLTP
ncbi:MULTISPECIES: DUF983 domain-containing protein [Azorhizobium]|uniref:Zinc-finger protein n=1 Tax=Azorhizobium caulinodans (strain ATCC 43989 / DSM 5975 / JCM 20966 / LMG 6465 / NBRC 14845 / NCIMB 13405 / ORS 571) TaxID=438753 RepID=A8I2D9_AZOC5|nr:MULTISPECIES: DUF983 domain-containing protein [Azorhizobium]TDT94875.1 uncharacterized protein (DUF983 family) [Azorhizobium sp. AG788]BAF87856.1 putative uncharacterized protein [Azorhizobium caulinodans ORS 571]